MPILAARTRAQLRIAIGTGLGVVRESSATTNGDATSMIDSQLPLANGHYNGQWVLPTSGTNDGEITQVKNSEKDTPAAGDEDLTLNPALSAATASGDTYELWQEKYPPSRLHHAINNAIIELQDFALQSSVDESVYGDYNQALYAIPTDTNGNLELDLIRKLEYRGLVAGATLLESAGAWDESTDTDATASTDTEMVREGNGSAKWVVTTSIANGDIIGSDSIALSDLSSYDTIEFWFRVSSAVAAADLVLVLSDQANAANPIEALSLPAAAARTWTRAVLTLANPELDTAIISIGLEYNASKKANYIWVNRLSVLQAADAKWHSVGRPLWDWSVNQESQEIVLKTGIARRRCDGRPIRITGYKKAQVLSAETDVCGINPALIMQLARSELAAAAGDGKMDRWQALAENIRRGLPSLDGLPTE